MRYYKLVGSDGEPRLAVEAEDGALTDLTSIDDDLTDIEDLALASSMTRSGFDEVVQGLIASRPPKDYDLAQIIEESREGTGDLWLDMPIEPPEVWAAGVTYKTSEMERRRESETPDIYSKVYVAERPELFFKATPDRCVGPFESVGIRGDSSWNVPEAELTFVLYKGRIIGYTIGNDMSSRSIEGENPLYLPQAKLYDRCCAIGPCFVTPDSLGDPYNLAVRCVVSRNGEEVFGGETSTSLMARRCEDLAEWLQRSNVVPNMTAVLTGTAIVPPPDFTLREGDVVTISIDGIGTLENDVVVV
jgi:2-dehydro-3-deoxy-D-arabinonate dehydratase